MDSLLATVQMPAGIPVATVAIGKPGATNAGILAAQMIGLSDSAVAKARRPQREAGARCGRKVEEAEEFARVPTLVRLGVPYLKGRLSMDPGIHSPICWPITPKKPRHWKRWFTGHPEALDLACDVAGAGSVRKLMLHIFATELFFANRVLGLPKADPTSCPATCLDELFAIHAEAHRKFQEFLAKATAGDGRTSPLGFGPSSQPRKMSRRPSCMAFIIAGNCNLPAPARFQAGLDPRHYRSAK